MIYITGDCHANFRKFNIDYFPEQASMTEDDVVIVCGDFGIWHNDVYEQAQLDLLEKKNFTIVFVDGNHENFDRLYSREFPVEYFCGGYAHKIRKNVWHLMRGYVFNFGKTTFFCFGGASSHDIQDGILDRADFDSDDEFLDTIYEWRKQNRMFRINHISWWKEELPSEEEMERGLKSLKEHDNKVDFIITHCCPREIAKLMRFYEGDNITRYFDHIMNTVDFGHWYFGHYHKDANIYDKFTCLYHKIERIV